MSTWPGFQATWGDSRSTDCIAPSNSSVGSLNDSWERCLHKYQNHHFWNPATREMTALKTTERPLKSDKKAIRYLLSETASSGHLKSCSLTCWVHVLTQFFCIGITPWHSVAIYKWSVKEMVCVKLAMFLKTIIYPEFEYTGQKYHAEYSLFAIVSFTSRFCIFK